MATCSVKRADARRVAQARLRVLGRGLCAGSHMGGHFCRQGLFRALCVRLVFPSRGGCLRVLLWEQGVRPPDRYFSGPVFLPFWLIGDLHSLVK